MDELIVALDKDRDKLKAAIRGRYNVAVERAKAEYKYRSSLGEAMAEARADGMAATALYDYCRGLDVIAKLREERDILQAQEDYLNELVYFYRSEIRIAEGQLKAERMGL